FFLFLFLFFVFIFFFGIRLIFSWAGVAFQQVPACSSFGSTSVFGFHRLSSVGIAYNSFFHPSLCSTSIPKSGIVRTTFIAVSSPTFSPDMIIQAVTVGVIYTHLHLIAPTNLLQSNIWPNEHPATPVSWLPTGVRVN
ncbi:hypothetical protein BC936DRAFT_144990, partial [Jimgerdemannia flammicorona]